MGDVFDAWDPSLQRPVAIKVLRAALKNRPLARDTELAGRFAREGAALARLDHPNIVAVYQSGVWEGQPFLAMARIDGGSLSARMDEWTQLGPAPIAAFVAKVAAAVQAAHDQGILHRDLKPSNILVDANGEPRVSDFGLAKFWTTDDLPAERPASLQSMVDTPTPSGQELTVTGVQPGTPSYMAPEQFDAAMGNIGPHTDVWALGVVLFELLTGERPFTGETYGELANRVCFGSLPSCRKFRSGVPRWLEAVVARCLAKPAAARYQSAGELAQALQAGLRLRRRQSWLIGTAALLGLVMCAGIVLGRWALTPGQDPTPEQVPEAPRPVAFSELPEVREALTRLSEGQEVILVDATHRAPHRWVFGPETGRMIEDESPYLTLLSKWTGQGAAEFLPNLPPGQYRIEAKIKHDSGGDFGRVGLYIGGRYWESGIGRHLGSVNVAFADVGPHVSTPGKTDTVPFQFSLTGEIRTQPRHSETFGTIGFPYLPAAAASQPPEFRSLSLIVTPSEVTGSWEGNRIGRMSREFAADILSRRLQSYPEAVPSNVAVEPFWGGVGLIVYNAVAHVEYFRIKPLK
jgi:serine/threonine-protein kinase